MIQPLTNILILAASVVVTMNVVASDPTPSKFSITMKRSTDRVVVHVENKTTIFSIRSPSGISNTVIQRTDEKWPERVVLRMYLKALENFQATNGKVTLAAAVSGHDETMRFRLWKDEREDVPLHSKSRYWMEIRRVGSNKEPTKANPQQGGYFEMALPKPMFDDNPQSITIHWIDFYRG